MKTAKLAIFYVSIPVLFFCSMAIATPSEHLVNGKESGWCYPLDDNSNGKPIDNISFGFMSYWNETYKYHYAQDITKGYQEGNSVYAMAKGEIINIRKSTSYGGGNPCGSDYNTLITKHDYQKRDGSKGEVFIFYGHLKNIIGIPNGASKKELTPVDFKDGKAIPIEKGIKIAELNDPACPDFVVHLHLTVMPDVLQADFYDGYNDTQNKNGRVRGFDCSKNNNGISSKDWVDKAGKQNIPQNDEAFFDTYRPYEQFVTGTWEGTWFQNAGGPESEFNGKMVLTQNGTSITGTSRIELIDEPQYYGVMNITGSFNGSDVYFQEIDIIENHPRSDFYWCIKSGTLNLSYSNGIKQLSGDWSAPGCVPGSVLMESKEETINDSDMTTDDYSEENSTNGSGDENDGCFINILKY